MLRKSIQTSKESTEFFDYEGATKPQTGLYILAIREFIIFDRQCSSFGKKPNVFVFIQHDWYTRKHPIPTWHMG